MHHTERRKFPAVALLLAIGALCGNQRAPAADAGQPGPRSVWDGAYTAQQDKRGSAVYATACAICHGPALTAGEAPPLAGTDFLTQWYGFSAGDLYERIRGTMPVNGPGSLSAQDYADVLAHIFSINRFPAGGTELEGSREWLNQIRIEAAKSRP